MKKEANKDGKNKLHPRSVHQAHYELGLLAASCPELRPFIHTNKYQQETIDFFDPKAVRALNKALLMHHYGIQSWEIPAGYLCPPIPGRADYIHYMADVLAASNQGKIPKGAGIRGLDIGTGASCIYPILAQSIYGWSFVGSEIDPDALRAAQKNVSANPNLEANIQVRKQNQNKGAFEGIIQENEYFDLTVCNPPFHASAADAEAGTRRKARNLGGPKSDKPVLNFGGKSNELWCEGGEVRFVSDMVRQSKVYGTSCFWYSSLLSKETSILPVTKVIQKAGAAEFQVIPMGQGSKSSRIVVWTFLSPKQQKIWAKTRW